MTRKRISLLLCIASLLIGLTACAPSSKQTEPMGTAPSDEELTTMLAGKVWVAEYIHGEPVVDMSHTSMVFTTKGKVNGRGGCNAYTGSYTLKNGKISFSPLAATMRMCAPALGDQERRFFQSLAEPQAVRFENGLLHFDPAEGASSVFSARKMD